MNEPTPLSPETVDALLSADLDGDLEAAARDLGLRVWSARGGRFSVRRCAEAS